MLGGIELQQLQKIDTDEDQVLTQHSVPALEGDFLQGLGRRATRVTLVGVMSGADAAASLKTLRDKYRAGEVVSFVADIATATKVDQVLIEEFGVRELAGKPARFEYELTLREFIPPPPPESVEPPPPPPPTPDPPNPEVGTLVVEVIVESEPGFDFATVTVTAEGTQESGTPLSRVLTKRENNFWTEDQMPPGRYTVRAVVTEPEAMSGEAQATVRRGQTEQVQITLRRGVNIAKAFIIHFRFDSAFFEPCMREVLERVFNYAQAHTSEKMVVVGHTDKQGPPDYNQQLSERRARSVFAFLTFGTSQALRDSAITDWDQLWRPGHSGLHDEWSVREQQYMLQDLEFYSGNIKEDPDAKIDAVKTAAAVSAFQSDRGLPATAIVDAATWKALVTAYLEAGALAFPEDRFLRNANAEEPCDEGILKWLGCGEQDPVRNTEDAWRPNRRVEILFVRVDKLPCKVPPPVTLKQPAPIATDNKWCLGPGDVNKRCCFTIRPKPGQQPDSNKLQVIPAEPAQVTVNGTVKFDDGSAVAKEEYTLIAPDGTFLHSGPDKNGVIKADLGEVAQGAKRGRPIPMRTDDDGKFSHPDPTPIGLYILGLPKLVEPAVARANEEPPAAAIGNVVCMNIESPAGPQPPGGTGATVQRSRIPAAPINPVITAASQFVVVKKSYTNPARVQITLRTNTRFRRSGTLTRTVTGAGGNIRLFNAVRGGTEITFNGTDNVFTGNSLTAGVRLFGESDSPSNALNDVQLTLTLAAGPTPVGPPATLTLTAVTLQLDISARRPAPGVAPPTLPQPPVAPPAAGTANDKWFGGRLLNAQDPGNHQERALLTVSRVQPPAFAGTLVLRQVSVAGDNVTGVSNGSQLFGNETPTAGEVAKSNPHEFNASTIPASSGLQLFVEGRNVSTRQRDSGFQLGIKDVENDGDRIALTVGVAPVIEFASPNVIVKKPHTNPARRQITLRTGTVFTRTGALTRASAAAGNTIHLFTAANGGTEITFDGTDNVFTGAQLTAGVQLFAEATAPSPAVDDFQLTLTLASGAGAPAGQPLTALMTAVELTLDIFMSRTSAGVDPAPLPQPPVVPPAVGAASDKWFAGRPVHVRTGSRGKRALLIVRQAKPAGFNGTLALRQVAVSGNDITGLDTKLRLFDTETGGAAKGNPHEMAANAIPAAGLRFFAEGATLSAGLRDTGFQLGIKATEDDGDRVALTVFSIDRIEAKLRATPCKRDGSRADVMPAKNSIADSKTFDATAISLVKDCGDLKLTATARPAAIQVSWDVERAADDTGLAGLPNHSKDGSDKKRLLKTDSTGSFHVHAFVDANGNSKRDTDEDGLILNVNMVKIEIPPGAAGNQIITRNTLYNDGRSVANTLIVDSGAGLGVPATNSLYTDAAFITETLAMKVTVKLTGGGANQRRGTDKIGLGYIQNFRGDSFRGTYADGRTVKEVFAVDPAIADPITGGTPALLGFPVRDHRGNASNGANTFINSSSDADQSPIAAGGQQRVVRFVDSPAIVIQRTHPVTGSALNGILGSNDFVAYLVSFSNDFDENFSVSAVGDWVAKFGTFSLAGGWTNVGATTTAAAAMSVAGMPKKGEDTDLERCPPGATDNLKMDAR